MDHDRKHTGDLAIAFTPQQCRENASILYHEFYNDARYVTAEQENPDLGGYKVKTSPATSDNHVHTAFMDAYGNGVTSFYNGHSHPVRAGLVTPFQDAMGVYSHKHPGILMEPGSEPDK